MTMHLCRVDFRTSHERPAQFARLEPIGRWEGADERFVRIANAHQEFRPLGRVRWHKPPTGFVDGSLCLVELRAVDPPGPDRDSHFVSGAPREPLEVLDVGPMAPLWRLRERLCIEGRATAATHPVLLRFDDGRMVGPLRLMRRDDGRFVARQADSERLPFVELAAGDVCQVVIDQRRTIVRPGASPRATGDSLDLRSDSEVLSSAMRDLWKHDQEAREALGLTRKVIQAYGTFIARGGVAGLDGGALRARLERLREMAGRVEEDVELRAAVLEELKDALTKSREVRAALAANIRRKRRLLSDRLARARQALEHAEREATRAHERHATELRELEDRARGAIEARLDAAAETLAQDALHRALMTRAPAVLLGAARERAGEERADVLGPDLATAVTHLRRTAMALGAHPRWADAALALLLAGRVPVLSGVGADAVVRALALTLSGGDLRRVIVGANVFQLADLFGHVSESGDRFIESASGLLTALRAARTASTPLILVLEGLNLSPPEACATPLLRSVTCPDYPLPIGSPHFAEGLRRHGLDFPMGWPPGAFVVAIAATGPAAFRFSEEARSLVGLAPSAAFPAPRTATGEVRPACVELSAWSRWTADVHRGSAAASLERFESLPSLRTQAIPGLGIVSSAFSAVHGNAPDAAFVDAALTVAVPQLAAELAAPEPPEVPSVLQQQLDADRWTTAWRAMRVLVARHEEI